MVLDLESAEFAEPEVSDVFEELLFFSSFSELLSMSMGSSLSSFVMTPFAPSEFSVDFLVTASTDAVSTIPFVFVAESLAVPITKGFYKVSHLWFLAGTSVV